MAYWKNCIRLLISWKEHREQYFAGKTCGGASYLPGQASAVCFSVSICGPPLNKIWLWKEKTMPQRRARSSFFGLAGGEKPDHAVRGAKKAPLWKGAMPARIAFGCSFKHI